MSTERVKRNVAVEGRRDAKMKPNHRVRLNVRDLPGMISEDVEEEDIKDIWDEKD